MHSTSAINQLIEKSHLPREYEYRGGSLAVFQQTIERDSELIALNYRDAVMQVLREHATSVAMIREIVIVHGTIPLVRVRFGASGDDIRVDLAARQQLRAKRFQPQKLNTRASKWDYFYVGLVMGFLFGVTGGWYCGRM
jgi:hypothetical protein